MKVLRIVSVGTTMFLILGASAYAWIYTRLPK
jgi:hypothetical protein